jgi:hypothetical protein
MPRSFVSYRKIFQAVAVRAQFQRQKTRQKPLKSPRLTADPRDARQVQQRHAGAYR